MSLCYQGERVFCSSNLIIDKHWKFTFEVPSSQIKIVFTEIQRRAIKTKAKVY